MALLPRGHDQLGERAERAVGERRGERVERLGADVVGGDAQRGEGAEGAVGRRGGERVHPAVAEAVVGEVERPEMAEAAQRAAGPAGPQRGLAEVLDAAVVDKVVREDENAQPVQLAARGGAREDARALGADARVPGKGGVARASKGCKKEGRARKARSGGRARGCSKGKGL